jgi:hypothetical protein
MSRLASLSGASFRPAHQAQTASSDAGKVASKVLAGGSEQHQLHRDSFDPKPSFACNAVYPDPNKGKGSYACNAVYPDPGKGKHDHGSYACNAVYPSGPRHQPKPEPLPLPRWNPQPRQDPGLFACSARVPDPSAPRQDPGLFACSARVPSPNDPPRDPGLYACSARVPASIAQMIEDLAKER